jgi:hypothetical protein
VTQANGHANGHDRRTANQFIAEFNDAFASAREATASRLKAEAELKAAQEKGDDANEVRRLGLEYAEVAAAAHLARRALDLSEFRLRYAQQGFHAEAIEAAAQLELLQLSHPELVPVALGLMQHGVSPAAACATALHQGEHRTTEHDAP